MDNSINNFEKLEPASSDKLPRSRSLLGAAVAVLSVIFLMGMSVCFIITPPKAILSMSEPKPDDGHGWVVALPKLPLPLWQRAVYRVSPNDVTLFEDGRPLPRPNSNLQDIRNRGAGRYSLSGHALQFSTSQNDNPITNGLVYELEIRTQPKNGVYRVTLLAFWGIVLLPLLRCSAIETRIKTGCHGFRSAWKSHSGKLFPARLEAALLRPEAADESGFPTGKILGPGFWRRHTPCLAGVALLALLGSYYRVSLGIGDGSDAVAYQAHGRALMERGTAPPLPLPYDTFVEQEVKGSGQSYSHDFNVYPNIGFQFLIGWLGQWRGDYSLINGALVAALFSVLLSVVLYIFGFTLTRSRLLSCGLVLFGLSHPSVRDMTGRPLTDIILLFFLFAALLPMSKGKSLLSGFIYGLGYLFREAGIFYLPVLALASPKSLTWRGYLRSTFAAGFGFSFWLAINRVLLLLLRPGGSPTSSSSSFYLNMFSGWLVPYWELMEIDLQSLKNLFDPYLLSFARAVNPLLFSSNFPNFVSFVLLILTLVLIFRLTTSFGRRLAVIGLWTLLIISIAMMPYGSIDGRYGIYAILLFWTAIFLALGRFRFQPLWLMILLIIILLPHLDMGKLRELSRPRTVWQHITAPMDALMHPGTFLKPESVILANFWYVDEMVFRSPVMVTIPRYYEDWRKTKGNERVDAISFYHRERWNQLKTWPADAEFYEDHYGVRFVHFKGLGDDLENWDQELQIYLREQIVLSDLE